MPQVQEVLKNKRIDQKTLTLNIQSFEKHNTIFLIKKTIMKPCNINLQ